jgi:hypothetical protein
MQLKRFDGVALGFVMYKVEGRFSCWFSHAGNMLDCMRRDRLGREYQVRKDSPAWQRLAKLGPLYRDSQPF